MECESKSHSRVETESGDDEGVQGLTMTPNSDDELITILDAAFDYRGDVTLQLSDGESVVGYVSNRDFSVDDPFVDVWGEGDTPRRVFARDVRSVTFSGRDTASGKSWQAWIEKVRQAEARGEIAELYPEELD